LPHPRIWETIFLIYGRYWRIGGNISYIAAKVKPKPDGFGTRRKRGSMPRFTPKIVTANALIEGDVVYQTADDRWSRTLSEAEVIADEAIAQLRLLEAQQQAGTVVGAYLAEARPGPNGPEPVHFREAFRTRGPSNYAHGKQERL
jgi:hypothetical protein